MVLIALCVGAVYLAGVTGQWWPTPDSALYQGLGRSLIRGQGYRFNGQINGDVTPGMPAILGVLRAAFGDGYLAPNLFVACCGLAGLYLACLTLTRLTDRRLSLAVALTTAACYTYYNYSHLILTDAPFCALFWLVAYASVRAVEGSRGWLWSIAPLTAVAIAVRAPGLMILGPWAAGIALHSAAKAPRRRRLVVAALLLGTAVVVGGLFYWLSRSITEGPPAYTTAAASKGGWAGRFYQVAMGLVQFPTAVTDILTDQSSHWLVPTGVLLALLAVAGGITQWRNGKRAAFVTCVLNLLGICFFIGYASVRARYMMAMYPMILLLIFRGLFWTIDRAGRLAGRTASPKVRLAAMTALVGAVIAANSPKILRDAVYYSYAAHAGWYYEAIRDKSFAHLGPVAKLLHERVGPEAHVASRADRVSMLHFLSERSVVPFLKTPRASAADAEAVYADLLSRQGVAVVVADLAGEDKSFRQRLSELLAGSSAPLLYESDSCNVYDWARRGRDGPTTRSGGTTDTRPTR